MLLSALECFILFFKSIDRCFGPLLTGTFWNQSWLELDYRLLYMLCLEVVNYYVLLSVARGFLSLVVHLFLTCVEMLFDQLNDIALVPHVD